MAEPKITPPPAMPPHVQQQAAQTRTYQDKKIVASRPSRQGDPGYELSCAEAQVTIILEDGTEKVVKSSELTTQQ
jgi:hypothetical protein